MDAPRHERRRGARPTVGYVINNPLVHTDAYIHEAWSGIVEGAKVADVNLICFAGTKVLNENKHLHQNASLFSQATPAWLDGFVACSHSDPVFRDLIPALGRVPTASIQRSQHPSVSVDNRAGMRACLEHLLDVHGRRRLAFVIGEVGEPSGEERFRTFQEVMRERGIAIDERLLFQGDNWARSGAAAVAAFIERRVEFDAIVASNDAMALGVLSALAERGYSLPEDVSVTGFDDFPSAAHSDPPLTTVRQPIRAMAVRAVEMVVEAMRGAPAANAVLPSELVVRSSCGCVSESIAHASSGTSLPDTASSRWRPRRRRRTLLEASPEILARARASLRSGGPRVGEEELADMITALVSDLGPGSGRAFLAAVGKLTARLAAEEVPIGRAHSHLSALRGAFLASAAFADAPQLARAENLWQQARVLVHEAGERQAFRQTARTTALQGALQELLRSLTGVAEVPLLARALAERLAPLGIGSAYLAVHEPGTERALSRLVMAYRDGQAQPLPRDGVRVPTRELLPPGFEMPADRRCNWMVVPIFLDFEANDQIGYAVFEFQGLHGELCYRLGDLLASPLKGALVLEALARDVAQRRAAEEQLVRELQSFLAVVDAAAEGDLTRRGAASQETLAKISTAVNGMFQQFSSLLAEVRQAAALVTRSSSEILAAATAIASGAQHSSDEVLTSTAAAEEMAASMDEVSAHAADSAERARQVLEHVQQSDASVQAAHQAMARIDEAVEGTASKMRLLERRTAEISDVIGVIDALAKRSKLLALNASIAAARAGEAGAGFAVVADEVGRLAESSTAAVADVARRVQGIVNDTQPALDSMEKATREVAEGRALSEKARASLRMISTLVQVSADLSGQIAVASREQAQATKLVAKAIQAVSTDATRSSAGAHETTDQVRRLVALAERLDRAVSRFRIEERGAALPSRAADDGPRYFPPSRSVRKDA